MPDRPPRRGAVTFIIVGKDMDVTFTLPAAPSAIAGIDRVGECIIREERWTPVRRFNRDKVMISYDYDALAAARQNGTGLRFDQPGPSLERSGSR